MNTEATNQTQATLNHHLQSFGEGNVEAILSDYSDEAVLFTPDGPLRGMDQLREFFTTFITTMPQEVKENFEMIRSDVEGEVAYITWTGGSTMPLGTDTFLVRNGKIVVQTLAAYSNGG